MKIVIKIGHCYHLVRQKSKRLVIIIIIIILIIYKQWVLGLLTMCVVLVIDDPQNNCIVIHTIKIRIMIGAGINYKKWSLVCLTLSPSVNEPD